jgi:hypothetical protein
LASGSSAFAACWISSTLSGRVISRLPTQARETEMAGNADDLPLPVHREDRLLFVPEARRRKVLERHGQPGSVRLHRRHAGALDEASFLVDAGLALKAAELVDDLGAGMSCMIDSTIVGVA